MTKLTIEPKGLYFTLFNLYETNQEEHSNWAQMQCLQVTF